MVMLRWLFLLVMLMPFGAANAQDDIARLKIELVERDTQPVVGEMVLVTIVGHYDVVITLESLKLPRVDGFDWVQLVRDKWTKEVIDGHSLKVMRRQIAVFPKTAGVITIGPFVQSLTVPDADGVWQERKIVAPAITLKVTPFPGTSAAGPKPWPLSAQALEYTDTWDKDPSTLIDGETATRTVTITALGVLPENLPPQPAMRERWLITFVSPEMRALTLSPEGSVATLKWVWQLRPVTGEPGVVEGVKIPWLNTKTRKIRQIELAPTPFGYASFATNRTALSRNGAAQTLYLVLTTLAGFVTASLLMFRGLRLKTGNWMNRLASWINTQRLWFLVKRAARRGHLSDLRRAAQAYLAVETIPNDAQGIAILKELDRCVYGQPVPDASFDVSALLSVLRR